MLNIPTIFGTMRIIVTFVIIWFFESSVRLLSKLRRLSIRTSKCRVALWYFFTLPFLILSVLRLLCIKIASDLWSDWSKSAYLIIIVIASIKLPFLHIRSLLRHSYVIGKSYKYYFHQHPNSVTFMKSKKKKKQRICYKKKRKTLSSFCFFVVVSHVLLFHVFHYS